MILDVTNKRITLVATPYDLRAGYRSLSLVAMAALDIDVDKGNDVVIFVSKNRELCKILWSDAKGVSTLVRRLRRGRFEQFLARAGEVSTHVFSAEDLNDFIDGIRIMVKPRALLAA